MGHGFEIRVNNNEPIRAGLDVDRYCVTCILDATRRKDNPDEELNINIGGYDADADVHFDWLKAELQPGDTIQITVVSGDYDPPSNTRPRITENDIIAQKLKYYNVLKEELEDYLRE
ncbi:hypothetical protein LZD49_22265 [Dyadobacter sp. CY261]|uniref:hypothetical protein n=1 Tax=Dyadobacter sp. CY261 TaxID=2907203 RepID=UPI001F181422|nr:hypothetical protein [Dyadobacter sp. CY261]MCF0073221.1 hypothetical protein [Dyadobacter sp. CY261]